MTTRSSSKSPTTNALAGHICQASDSTDKEKDQNAKHIAERLIERSINVAAGTDCTIALHECQADLTLVAAKLYPGIAVTAGATNFVTVTLQRRASDGGAATALDSWDTDTGNVSLTIGTSQAFTIVEASDNGTVGQIYEVDIAHTGSGDPLCGTFVLEYELAN